MGKNIFSNLQDKNSLNHQNNDKLCFSINKNNIGKNRSNNKNKSKKSNYNVDKNFSERFSTQYKNSIEKEKFLDVDKNYIIDSISDIQNGNEKYKSLKENTPIADEYDRACHEDSQNSKFIPPTHNYSGISKNRFTLKNQNIKNLSNFPVDVKELKALLEYLDSLLGGLSYHTIENFANSYYFNLYKKILKQLNIHK